MMIAKHIRRMTGYVYGEQPKARNLVKLNTNENAYPPSPECAKVLSGLDLDRLRRYPDPEASALKAEIAKLNHTTPENIFIGNGSDEILSLLMKAFVENDENIASLDPSYSLYKTLADIRDVKWFGIDADDFADTGKTLAALQKRNVSLFLLTNPNAPTGKLTAQSAIAAFAKRFKGVLLVDEAYADFSRENCMAMASAEDNRNLIVMRTFSKSFSLAGLRVGYCVGPKPLIAALTKIKDSYNIDALAQMVALAAVKDIGWMRNNVAKIVRTRESLTRALEKRGWDVIKSESNFIFARPPHNNAAEIFEYLRGRHIYVRYFSGPKTRERLRVTIGTESQIKKLLKALDESNL